MAMYYYTKENVNISALVCEINLEPVISGTLDYAYFDFPDDLQIYFMRDLYSNEHIALDTVVSGHTGEELSEEDYNTCYGQDVNVHIDEQEDVVDPQTGVSGTYLLMELLRISRDLYNEIDNILYIEDYKSLFGAGGYIEDLNAKPDTLLELTDTPAVYDNGKYLKSTASGVEWVVVSGTGVYGTEYNKNASESLSCTNSTNYKQKLRLSVSNLPAGIYRIGWYYELAFSSSCGAFKGKVELDDTTVLSDIVCKIAPIGKNYFRSESGFSNNNLSGSHTIDIDYCSSKNRKVAYIRRARIELWRIS